MLKFPFNDFRRKHSKYGGAITSELNPDKPMKSKLLGALCLLFCVILLIILFSVTSHAETGMIAGLNSSNWHRFAHMGLIENVNKDLSVFLSGDIGGGETNVHLGGILRIPFGDAVQVGFLFGPDLTVIERNLTTNEKLYYIGAATGISLAYTYNDKLSFFYAFQYMNIEQSQSQAKMGIGLILWMGTEEE